MTAWRRKTSDRWKRDARPRQEPRVRLLYSGFVVVAALIAARLFLLQVIDHHFYEALATGQHELFEQLFPARGQIYVHDMKDGSLVAVATNEQLAFVYADPRHVDNPEETAKTIGTILGWTDDQVSGLSARLGNRQDPYEPVAHHVSDDQLDKITTANLSGIAYTRESVRLYPEDNMGGHILGFVGSDADGHLTGKYGIEGYYNDILTGTPGFSRSERDISGRLIAVADSSFEPAVNGADIVLTIDRNIQYEACTKLHEAVQLHGATGGSVVIVDPKTGRILAMCGAPDFDPNNYGAVTNLSDFNNPAIFNAYEPGSVFKGIVMAAAMDAGAVTPSTTFNDNGQAMVDGWPKPIGNALGKAYGTVDMTSVLENSINTGMIFAMRQMGMDVFVKYMKDFGFGQTTGVELSGEMPGDMSSLDRGQEIYAATASFGQGVTATPLQITMAYAALANGGVLLEPHIVDEIRYPDGRVDKTETKQVRQVVSAKTSQLVGAMLVSVVENGLGKKAAVPGYYIAGKTGTAQVASTTGVGYDPDVTIGSFGGFGPVSDPKFAMLVRIDNPKDVQWAETTAAPLFGEIAQFLLRYDEVPPER